MPRLTNFQWFEKLVLHPILRVRLAVFGRSTCVVHEHRFSGGPFNPAISERKVQDQPLWSGHQTDLTVSA